MILHKDIRKQFHNLVEQYNNDLKINNDPDYISEIKCISDRILLYIRYGIFRCHMMYQHRLEEYAINDQKVMKLKDGCMFIYEKIRGNEKYTNKDPRLVAAAILYIASVMQGVWLTQYDVGKALHASEVSIRTYYKMIKKLEKL